MPDNKLKIGIYELTGCAGDALLIVDCEEELVNIFKAADIEAFLMAKSDNNDEIELDVALVEGSVSTEKELSELIEIRKRSKALIAIGICAGLGGMQANFSNDEAWAKNFKAVYGEAEFIHSKALPSKPIGDFVKVDYYLPGCPIGKEQFLSTFARLLAGNPPELFRFPVCMECKWHENDCLLNKNIFCMGPLTAAGCGAVCVNHNLPCVGCWGPSEEANRTAEYRLLLEKGFDPALIKNKMANFSGTRIFEFFAQFKGDKK